MTFKSNLKPSESVVIQLLAKLAIEKGMIKIEPSIEKKASKDEDIIPSENFSENLVMLCSSLRKKGLASYASELENKFVSYKKAETHIYNVHNESGDDVIDMAHPNGSNQLDGLGNKDLGTVETQLDQHKKIMDVINSLPKKKLAAKNAINAVKLIIAQNVPNELSLNEKIDNIDNKDLVSYQEYYISIINKSIKLIDNIIAREKDLSDWNWHESWIIGEADTGLGLRSIEGHLDGLKNNLKDLSNEEASSSNNKEIKINLKTLVSIVDSASHISAENKSKYTAIAREISSKVDNAIDTINNKQNIVPNNQIKNPEENSKSQILLQRFDTDINSMKFLKARIIAKQLDNADALNQWIDKLIALTNSKKEQYLGLEPKPASQNDQSIIDAYNSQLDKIKSKVDTLRQQKGLL